MTTAPAVAPPFGWALVPLALGLAALALVAADCGDVPEPGGPTLLAAPVRPSKPRGPSAGPVHPAETLAAALVDPGHGAGAV